MQNHKSLMTLLFLAALALCLNVAALAVPQSGDSKIEPVASMKADVSKMTWEPKIGYEALTLTVATPDGEVLRQEGRSGVALAFSVMDAQGQQRPDGQYRYELRVTPILEQGVREILAEARRNGTDEQTLRGLRKQGLLPTEGLVQSGTFRVLNGAIVSGGATEPQKIKPRDESPRRIAARSGVAVPADQVIAEDLIVQSSICVGFDCVNGESFGADTIKLKENNLRIKFEDTSTAAGFATVDWQLTANDQPSGGANQFSIEDITNAKVPFLIEANATSHSIYVDNSGRVGFRTSTPLLDLHTNTGNTPALRLEQNGSSGFTAQTWDVGANEANFFVRDLTGGSRLPFRIRPGAPTSSLDIKSSGNVGIGTDAPEQKLHVAGNVVIDGSLEVRDGSFFNMAAMKALYERLLQRETEIQTLRQKNDELQTRVAEFERRMQALEARVSGKR